MMDSSEMIDMYDTFKLLRAMGMCVNHIKFIKINKFLEQ